IIATAPKVVIAVVELVLGPRAAAALEEALGRIQGRISQFFRDLQNRGKTRFRSSGIGQATYEGPARTLHPDRFAQIIDDLDAQGVNVNVRTDGNPWEAAYTPGAPGEPGTISVHRDVDIRTLEHEYKHFLDDKAGSYPGLRFYIENPEVMLQMEEA